MNNQKGFTIIEMTVVVSIIVLFAALVVPNYRAGERNLALQRSAEKMAQDVRRVVEMSMSAAEFQGEVPAGGYGVFFDKNNEDQYIIFTDNNGNSHYDPGSDGLVEKIDIEKEVEISQLSSSPSLYICFLPPDPEVIIKPNSDFAQITLSLKNDPTKTKTVTINKAGLIYTD
ncbi:MAG: type II secretion system protein [Candidatus Nealsonbacteria bacterium]